MNECSAPSITINKFTEKLIYGNALFKNIFIVQFESQRVQCLMSFSSDVSFTRKTLEKKSLEKNGFEIRSI